jgi:hypothetical protein
MLTWPHLVDHLVLKKVRLVSERSEAASEASFEFEARENVQWDWFGAGMTVG